MKVEVVEVTDDPAKVACTAARNDYMPDWVGEKEFEQVMESIGGETLQEQKETLIKHLLKQGHFGPFEHPQATFAVKGISRSCMAQITRHRHASFDVQSMRYVDFRLDEDELLSEKVVEIPELEDPGITGRNAEFAEEVEDWNPEKVLSERERVYWNSISDSFRNYIELLDLGVAPENARMVLPIGTRVNMVFSCNARQLMHIADMRAAADAQWEIRNMTKKVLDEAQEWFPECFDYYEQEMKNRKNRLAP